MDTMVTTVQKNVLQTAKIQTVSKKQMKLFVMAARQGIMAQTAQMVRQIITEIYHFNIVLSSA